MIPPPILVALRLADRAILIGLHSRVHWHMEERLRLAVNRDTRARGKRHQEIAPRTPPGAEWDKLLKLATTDELYEILDAMEFGPDGLRVRPHVFNR